MPPILQTQVSALYDTTNEEKNKVKPAAGRETCGRGRLRVSTGAALRYALRAGRYYGADCMGNRSDPVEFQSFKADVGVAPFQAGMMPPVLAFLLGLMVQIGLLDQSLEP